MLINNVVKLHQHTLFRNCLRLCYWFIVLKSTKRSKFYSWVNGLYLIFLLARWKEWVTLRWRPLGVCTCYDAFNSHIDQSANNRENTATAGCKCKKLKTDELNNRMTSVEHNTAGSSSSRGRRGQQASSHVAHSPFLPFYSTLTFILFGSRRLIYTRFSLYLKFLLIISPVSNDRRTTLPTEPKLVVI